jgi:hypothetical protein
VLVAVTGFGSIWRSRLGKQGHEGGRFAQPVYYNTTGVAVNGSTRQRPQICGYARFDAIGSFDPNHLSRMINRVFECAEPSVWMGCNKLLFKRMLKAGERPDCFLVVARSDLTGQLAVGTEGWRSVDTWLLSLSECASQQEAMLLMPANGWIGSSLGRYVLESSESRAWIATLVLSSRE